MPHGAIGQETAEAAPLVPRGVFFRMAFLAQEMCVHPDDKVHFKQVGKHAVSVDITNVGTIDGYKWWTSPSSRCTGTAYWQMPRKAYALYEAISATEVPDTIDPETLSLSEDMWNRSPFPVFRSDVPAFLTTAIAEVEREIKRVVSQVVGLTRWRCNRPGPVELHSLGPHEWSMDGSNWSPNVCRPASSLHAAGPDLVLSQARLADIEELLQNDKEEPVYQSLLREAESLLESNPRSAIAIGTTAAEVAIKALVSKLAPQTGWLIENLPSPPIVKIVKEYLPQLLSSDAPQFDEQLIQELTTAVSLRNKLVHGGNTSLEISKARSTFIVLRDIVWLCDYFSGATWAANRVSSRVRTSMNLLSSVNATDEIVD